MKVYNAVKTEEKAKEILKSFKATNFEKGSCMTEVGESSLLIGYNDNYDMIGSVSFCEICGDDDAWIDEVFND